MSGMPLTGVGAYNAGFSPAHAHAHAHAAEAVAAAAQRKRRTAANDPSVDRGSNT